MGDAKQPNTKLRYERELRGWSQRYVAEQIGTTEQGVNRWESGQHKPSRHFQTELCKLFGKSAEELGFMPAQAQEEFSLQSESIIVSKQGEIDLNKLRRLLLQGIAGFAVSPSLLVQPTPEFIARANSISDTSLHELAKVTAHLRTIYLQGDVSISQELFAHLSVLQEALNTTMDDRQRHELWRLLAQTQLLCRFNLPKRDMVKAKTFNEQAIASARNSGDVALVGAAIGHLAHFYLRIEKAPKKASQILDEAQIYIQQQRALVGWFALLYASLAAIEGNGAKCEKHISTALEMAHDTRNIIDPYFTDFSVTSVNVFAGNSLLTVEQPQKAYEWLMKASMEDLSPNRHASAYYDIARACAASNQLEAAQEYALKSMDCAVATDNLYIIPRFISLANTIQQKYPGNAHASLIGDYALSMAYAHGGM